MTKITIHTEQKCNIAELFFHILNQIIHEKLLLYASLGVIEQTLFHILGLMSIFNKIKHFIRAPIIEKAMYCEGWTSPNTLLLIYDLIIKTQGIEGDILEIGSAWGRSTVLFGLVSKKNIWSIDPHTGGRAFIEMNKLQNSYEGFIQNLKKFKLDNRVRILKYTTHEVIEKKLIPDKTFFSLVFIDGLHTPEGVKLDFQLSYPKLQKGGVIIFDDYFQPTVKDYKEMIDELVALNRIRLLKNHDVGIVYAFKEI